MSIASPADPLPPLLETLYAGLTDAEPWHAFLRALAAACDATYATLVMTAPDAALEAVVTRGAEPLRSDDYEHVHAVDPFIGLPEGRVIAFTDFVRDAEIAPNFRTFLDLSGTGQILGVDLHAGSGAEARLRITRDRSRRDFGVAQRRLLDRLVPHLRIAFGLHARLGATHAESQAYGGAIERLAVATMILGPGGRIVRRNAVAERLLGQTGAWTTVGGTLVLRDPEARHALAGMLVQPPVADCALTIPRRDAAPYEALVRPVLRTPYADATRGLIALFIADPDAAREVDPAALRDRFQLTPTEANLAARLADGESLSGAAQALGVTHNTARAHLRAIFAKTGAHRQAQLVHLLRTALSGFARD
jgi:DNA-binding CsgD family transcriptional regulator